MNGPSFTRAINVARIDELTLPAAIEIVENCRDTDVAGWQPFYFTDVDHDFAVERWRAPGLKRVMYDEAGDPIAMGGLSLVAPKTWTAWFIAVPGWQRHARHVIRFARPLLAAMFERGEAERIQAWVLAGDDRALKFAMKSMGFEHEALCKKYVSGVDFHQLRRLR